MTENIKIGIAKVPILLDENGNRCCYYDDKCGINSCMMFQFYGANTGYCILSDVIETPFQNLILGCQLEYNNS